jgi:DHA1 family bicyclomycin/chloramphenicol resistance-like MFS transporter
VPFASRFRDGTGEREHATHDLGALGAGAGTMSQRAARLRRGGPEFLAIVSTCMAMAALSIDLLLPAFPDMREAFGLPPGSTEISRVITTFFFGLAVGQLVYGPLSDTYGRKRMLWIGLGVFVAGAIASAMTTSLAAMGVTRFVWGFGAAACRSIAIAMVRDTFEGDRMARTMSFVMAAFIMVPVFAPAVGAGLLVFVPWEALLWIQAAAGVGLALWLVRMPETLHEEDRRPVSPRALGAAALAVVRNRQSVVFGLAQTTIFGIITSYLGTSEVVIDEVFGQSDRFALIFGVLAVTIAAGSLLSARLVVQLGLARLVRYGSLYLIAAACVLVAVVVTTEGQPPLWAYCLSMALLLPGISIIVPSCNTAAMAPLGHIAGMGAAILGTVATAGGALLGSLTDQAYDGTLTPFALHVLAYVLVGTGGILLLGRVEPTPAAEVTPEPVPA